MEPRTPSVLFPFLALATALPAQALPSPSHRVGGLPVRELTAFKDGHAFVHRAGNLPIGADGKIVLDELPTPMLGTFWPAIDGSDAKLVSVTAAKRVAERTRTALEIRELVLANPGAEVIVRETGDVRYPATIVGIPARPGSEARGSDDAGPHVAVRSDLVMLKTETTRKDTSAERVTDAGTRLVRLDRIVDLTFQKPPNTKFTEEHVAPRLVLEVAAKGTRPETVPVSVSWLQPGFRWIPNYRIELDGKGKASVRLQATLVNDLVDLENATLHLVVGVPSFAAKGEIDPISLRETAAAVAARSNTWAGQQLSNAFMTQLATNAPAPEPEPSDRSAGGELAGGRKEEDLYVFTKPGITLRRSERMTIELLAFQTEYRDVWKLDVPIAQPREFADGRSGDAATLARLAAAPKVKHSIRLENASAAPLTTAPALVVLGERVLAQGTTTYTPAGQSCDVAVTTAIDISVRKTDREVVRTPNAESWNGNSYARAELAGKLELRNRRTVPVTVEVTRYFLGKLGKVEGGGTVEQLLDDDELVANGDATLGWRSAAYYPWSSWWSSVNGVGRAKWIVTLEPGKGVELGYAWSYLWR